MNNRNQRLANGISLLLRQYTRRKHAGHDPNDRAYDRRVEQMVRRMNPEELDHLMREDGEPSDGPN